MDKYDMAMKMDELYHLCKQGKYKRAYVILQTIEIGKIKNQKDLYVIVTILCENEDYRKAKAILRMIYKKSKGKRVLHQLVEICIKSGEIEEAKKYYKQFCELAPNDIYVWIFQYQFLCLQGGSIDEKICLLKKIVSQEYVERWAYELAEMYYMNNQQEDCERECKELILMFGDGVYVEKARRLLQYAPQDLKEYEEPSFKEEEAISLSVHHLELQDEILEVEDKVETCELNTREEFYENPQNTEVKEKQIEVELAENTQQDRDKYLDDDTARNRWESLKKYATMQQLLDQEEEEEEPKQGVFKRFFHRNKNRIQDPVKESSNKIESDSEKSSESDLNLEGKSNVKNGNIAEENTLEDVALQDTTAQMDQTFKFIEQMELEQRDQLPIESILLGEELSYLGQDDRLKEQDLVEQFESFATKLQETNEVSEVIEPYEFIRILGPFIKITDLPSKIIDSLEIGFDAYNKGSSIMIHSDSNACNLNIASRFVSLLQRDKRRVWNQCYCIEYKKFLTENFSEHQNQWKSSFVVIHKVTGYDPIMLKQMNYLIEQGVYIVLLVHRRNINVGQFQIYQQYTEQELGVCGLTKEQIKWIVDDFLDLNGWILDHNATEYLEEKLVEYMKEGQSDVIAQMENLLTNAYHCINERNKVELSNLGELGNYKSFARTCITLNDLMHEN
mgnify:CR=1 FL=1